MLLAMAAILVLVWALGLVTAHPAGSALHTLAALAVVVLLVRLVSGRRTID